MIDTDKYEPTKIDFILHHTRAHSPDEWPWPKYSNSLNELSEDDRLLIKYAPTLRAEVIRLREEVSSVIRGMLSDSEESPSWGATVHAYIKDLQKVIE